VLVQIHALGITGRAWRWIRAFLSGRRLRVVHANLTSDWFDLSAGTPQGAMLSPSLFVLALHDLAVENIVLKCLLQFFADDILLAPPKGVLGVAGDREVQKALTNLAFELIVRKMNLSKEKCTVLVCSRQEAKAEQLTIEGVPLPVVEKQDYVGVVLNSRLDWSDHFAKVIARTNRAALDIVANVSLRYPSWSMIRLLFQALVLSLIAYGMPVWAPTKAQSDRLVSSVARGLSLVLRVEHNPSALSLFVESNFLCPSLEHACSAIRYARRHDKSKASNPISEKLRLAIVEAKRASVIPSVPQHVIAASKLLNLEWDAKDSDNKSLRKAALQFQFSNLFLKPALAEKAKLLKSVKKEAGVSSFLLLLNREEISLFSALRLGRWELNELMFKLKKEGASATASCPIAGCASPESVQHVLMDCPSYAAPRAVCSQKLQRLGSALSLQVLLGGVEHLPEAKRKLVLQSVYWFLRAVCQTRF
jgi:hypothetical protein